MDNYPLMTIVSPPEQIACDRKLRELKISFKTQGDFSLSFALLRSKSPAADGKCDPDLCAAVDIVALDAVGNYAIKPRFSDGHDTGIYSWSYLLELCERDGRRL